eukprot:364794-Chlamydomonas_euryale.AAC.16
MDCKAPLTAHDQHFTSHHTPMMRCTSHIHQRCWHASNIPGMRSFHQQAQLLLDASPEAWLPTLHAHLDRLRHVAPRQHLGVARVLVQHVDHRPHEVVPRLADGPPARNEEAHVLAAEVPAAGGDGTASQAVRVEAVSQMSGWELWDLHTGWELWDLHTGCLVQGGAARHDVTCRQGHMLINVGMRSEARARLRMPRCA